MHKFLNKMRELLPFLFTPDSHVLTTCNQFYIKFIHHEKERKKRIEGKIDCGGKKSVGRQQWDPNC